MQGHVTYVICVLLAVALYVNLTVMGTDNETAALNQIRNSSGQLIKYGQAN